MATASRDNATRTKRSSTETRLEHPARELQKYNISTRAREDVPSNEMYGGVVAISVWVILFAAGLFVPTQAYRDALLNGQLTWFSGPAFFLVVVICYTVTNLLFLCCAASYIGCMSRRWYVMDGQRDRVSGSIPPLRLYLSSILRGFLLYLMVVAGLIIVSTEEALLDMQFGQYIRIAGMASVLAFVVGYDPNMINRFISRVVHAADLPETPKSEATHSSKSLHPLERILNTIRIGGQVDLARALEQTGLNETDLADSLADMQMEIVDLNGARVIRSCDQVAD